MSAMTITVIPCHPALGAEVRGVDARQPIDSATRQAVIDAWTEYLVLVFPGQDITDQEHVAFTRHFGEPEIFHQTSLSLRSDRVNARLALAFDLSGGRYLAALQGRVNNYLVNSVGLFSVDTNLNLTSGPAGFGLTGRVAARSRRIDNDTIRNLLGGDATITARVAMDPSGLVHVGNVMVHPGDLIHGDRNGVVFVGSNHGVSPRR